MLNSSYFLKQLGYVDILKYWNIFVADPNEQITFPRFIKQDLVELILDLAEFESREAKKELTQELERMKLVISKEVAPKLKDKMNVFKIKPSEAFSQIRKLMHREQFTVHDLIEGTRKIQQAMMDDDEESHVPYRLSQNPTLEKIKEFGGVTESTRGSDELNKEIPRFLSSKGFRTSSHRRQS